jgi:predicted metal-dependent hydrolase
MSELAVLHPLAKRGLASFNEGKYFEAHDKLEEAWHAEKGEIRGLYKGILQVAVAYLHLTMDNYAGVVKMYERSQKWLAPWPDVVMGIQIGQLRNDFDLAIAEVHRLGPERLHEFNLSLLKPITYEPDK